VWQDNKAMERTLLNPGVFLLAPLSIATFCFLVSVGDPKRFIDWPYLWLLFRNISPYFWAVTGVALCVGTSILGAAW
jgi:hypothetical protein